MPKNHKTGLQGIGIEVAGWLLVAAGIAALVLPGPGLLGLFAGIALLSTRYDWAERRLEPVKKAAFNSAEQSVATWPRIAASAFGACVLIGFGITWGIRPAVPDWWPIADKFWLAGGWGTGSTLIGSGVIAFGIIVYSYRKFH